MKTNWCLKTLIALFFVNFQRQQDIINKWIADIDLENSEINEIHEKAHIDLENSGLLESEILESEFS